jgi:hypothetical protein
VASTSERKLERATCPVSWLYSELWVVLSADGARTAPATLPTVTEPVVWGASALSGTVTVTVADEASTSADPR